MSNWLAVRWDKNNDEIYTTYGRQSNSEQERKGTEYWVISDRKYLKNIEALEEHKDCVKVWQCGSYEEARELSRLLCRFDTEREKAANKYKWVLWLCIIGFGLFMLSIGERRAKVQAIKKGHIEQHGMTYSVEYESGTFSPPDPPDGPW